MAKRKKRYTGLYTPGLSTEVVFLSIDPPDADTDLDWPMDVGDNTELPIPVGFIDAWSHNENYKELLANLEITHMEYQEIVQELQRFYSKESQGEHDADDKELPIQVGGYSDCITSDIRQAIKYEIVDLHQRF